MHKPLSLPLIGLFAFVLGGCGTQVARIDHNQLTPMADSIVEGKSVAVETEAWELFHKGGGLVTMGHGVDRTKLLRRRYDKDSDINAGGPLFVRADKAAGTREMLAAFQPTLEQGLRAGGGRIAALGEAQYLLEAQLTFGPYPAPAYTRVKLGEATAQNLVTLGFGATPNKVWADYELTLRLRDQETGEIVRERTETVFHGYDETHREGTFDLGVQKKNAAAAKGAFIDSIEGQIASFLK